MNIANFLYLGVNLVTFFSPFIVALFVRDRAWVSFRKYFISIAFVSTGFLIWDAFATTFGHWGFAKEYTLGPRIFGMPLEEILFFVTTPYACLFIFESVKYFYTQKTGGIEILMSEEQMRKNKIIWRVGAVFSLLVTMLTWPNYYTVTIFALLSILLFWMSYTNNELFRKMSFWYGMLVVYVPFFIMNSILTSFPVVWYSSEAIMGIRVGTIPLEDFFYNFSLITLYKLLYDRVK